MQELLTKSLLSILNYNHGPRTNNLLELYSLQTTYVVSTMKYISFIYKFFRIIASDSLEYNFLLAARPEFTLLS